MASVDRKSQRRNFYFIGRNSCVEKGYTIVAKRLPQMCTTVQLREGEGSFCCALAWWERWEGENPRWRTMLVFVFPLQTFQLDNQTFQLDGHRQTISSADWQKERRSFWELFQLI